MQNVTMSRQGRRLTIVIDLDERGSPSKSGKTTTIASTRGNRTVPGTKGFKVGVTCFAYPEAELEALEPTTAAEAR